MNKTTITFLASTLLLISGVKAQTLQEGVNHVYAQRYNSAISVFEKMLATNPNNIEATYWLGQAYLNMEEIAGARREKTRQLYEKALQATQNAPLILVGMGQVQLLENKTNDARQSFETALTMSRTKKGDDPAIITAIGRANVDAKAGDFNYAIDKLNTIPDKDKNAETYLVLGNAYRKAKPGEGGGDAYTSYNKAIQLNPNFAPVYLRLAKLFESQKNWELVLQYLNQSVAKDPNFTAGYFELFYYYFYRTKYPEAEEQLKKYIDTKLPENDIQDQYLYAMLCWARKDFDCAITKGESVVTAMGNLTKPKVYRMLADAYYQNGNYANAKKYSDEFFAKKNPDDPILPDYENRAAILSKLESSPDDVFNTYIAGVGIDTTVEAKIDFLKKGADYFKARGDSVSRNKEGDIRLALLKLKPNSTQRDIFDAGFAYYQGKNYTRSDSLYGYYTDKWPDETFGWQMRFQIGRIMDSTMAKGLAVPFGIKYLEVLQKDTAKNKKNIVGVANYLAQYYANIEKDRDKAIEYLKIMLIYDPTNDIIINNIKALEKMPATKTKTKTKDNPAPSPPAKAVKQSVSRQSVSRQSVSRQSTVGSRAVGSQNP